MKRIIVLQRTAEILFVGEALPADWSDVPVLASVGPEDVRGATVVGNLPFHLAALARCVGVIEFAGSPPPNGQEYGLEAMRAAGARIRWYTVKAVAVRPPIAPMECY